MQTIFSKAPGGLKLEKSPASTLPRDTGREGLEIRQVPHLGIRAARAGLSPPHGWGKEAGGGGGRLCRRKHLPPGGRERCLSPAPAPSQLPPPTRPRAAPRCLTAPPGAVEGGGGRPHRHLLISPTAGIYLAGEPALPGPAPTSTALPAAAGDKGEGPLRGALAPHPPAGQAAAATPLPTPSESGAGGRHLSSSSETALSAQSPSSPEPSRDAVS